MNTLRQAIAAAALLSAVAGHVSCGDVVRQGRSPVLILVDKMSGIPGTSSGSGTAADGVLNSDVEIKGSTFNDLGSATMRLVPKNVNTTPAGPLLTTNNEVTIARIHVSYRRADGQNQPGLDVPYP